MTCDHCGANVETKRYASSRIGTGFDLCKICINLPLIEDLLVWMDDPDEGSKQAIASRLIRTQIYVSHRAPTWWAGPKDY